jgi:hypothetical protein
LDDSEISLQIPRFKKLDSHFKILLLFFGGGGGGGKSYKLKQKQQEETKLSKVDHSQNK